MKDLIFHHFVAPGDLLSLNGMINFLANYYNKIYIVEEIN